MLINSICFLLEHSPIHLATSINSLIAPDFDQLIKAFPSRCFQSRKLVSYRVLFGGPTHLAVLLSGSIIC